MGLGFNKEGWSSFVKTSEDKRLEGEDGTSLGTSLETRTMCTRASCTRASYAGIRATNAD